MIEIDVIAYLKNDDTLGALLNASASDFKIYPDQSPHSAVTPYIIISTNSCGSTEENLKEISLAINCIAVSITLAKTIRDRVEFLLDQQDNIQTLITSTECRVLWAKHVGGSSFMEPDQSIFHHALIFDFKYIELSQRYIDVINKVLTIPMWGTFIDEKEIWNGFYFPATVTIKKIGLHVDTAPTGANVTVDILKDDVEQTRVATLAAGSKNQVTDITDINFSATEKFGLKIKSVGTIEAGEGGTVAIYYQ
jgi:hypothetical protein